MIELNELELLGRKKNLFKDDLSSLNPELKRLIKGKSFLIIGGAGTIGQSVTREIFKFSPDLIHVVDISENNLVELVRDLRSTFSNSKIDFKTFALDVNSQEFDSFIKIHRKYNFVVNLSALKHVRSEKDPFTLSRLIDVNIFNSIKLARISKEINADKYFCVSTDKAANPTNMMGSSKKIMESFLIRESKDLKISFARFANVAFSDGSLLYGFNQRFEKKQPLSAPRDIRRYFLSKEESGILCLLSLIFGKNREIFFPKLTNHLKEINFSDIAKNFIFSKGFEPFECSSEAEAIDSAKELIKKNKYPCYFFNSDTSGEKEIEEFFTKNEKISFDRFKSIGVIKNPSKVDDSALENLENSIMKWRKKKFGIKKL